MLLNWLLRYAGWARQILNWLLRYAGWARQIRYNSNPSKKRVSPVDTKINLEELINALDFSEERVVDAAKEQPRLFINASRYRVRKLRERIRSESRLKEVAASLSLRIRANLKALGGDTRITEGLIQARLYGKREYKEADAAVATATEYDEFSRLLVEAYRQRAAALRVVQEVMGIENAMAGRLQESDFDNLANLRKKVKAKYPGGKL